MQATTSVHSENHNEERQTALQVGELNGHRVSPDTSTLVSDPAGCAQVWGAHIGEDETEACCGYACCQSSGPIYCACGSHGCGIDWCC